MKEAESVEVLSVDPKDSYKQDASVAGADIAAALARHGVKVTYSSEESDGMSHAEVIENRISRSEEHTSELQSLMRISYAVLCLNKKTQNKKSNTKILTQ